MPTISMKRPMIFFKGRQFLKGQQFLKAEASLPNRVELLRTFKFTGKAVKNFQIYKYSKSRLM
jgi:hypothetical protein